MRALRIFAPREIGSVVSEDPFAITATRVSRPTRSASGNTGGVPLPFHTAVL